MSALNVTKDQTGFDLFRAIVEQSPDAIIVADRAGVIQAWNSAAMVIGRDCSARHLAANALRTGIAECERLCPSVGNPAEQGLVSCQRMRTFLLKESPRSG